MKVKYRSPHAIFNHYKKYNSTLMDISIVKDESIDIDTYKCLILDSPAKEAIIPKLTNIALVYMSREHSRSHDFPLVKLILSEMTDRLLHIEEIDRILNANGC
ncbi:hypothetical protein KLEB273_gp217 [Bacillus phage vB_BauM_KLEB27-3]|nr:hypothetical protein KLEB273_gp217 [Bacillus phage vB_BauM_KLEB27-3]